MEDAQGLIRKLRAISDCNKAVLRAVSEHALLDEICSIICDSQVTGYRWAWVGFAQQDEGKSVLPVAWKGVDDEYLQRANITWADTERGRGPTGTCIRTGMPCHVQDYAVDSRLGPWRDAALARGVHSSIALPLKREDGLAFGALTIYGAGANVFTPDEIELLEGLADNLAYGILALRARVEAKRVEQVLRDSDERQRLIFENTGDVLWTWSVKTNQFTFISPSILQLRGYTAEEVMQQRMEDALTPESFQYSMAEISRRFQAMMAGDMSARVQRDTITQKHKNGSLIQTEIVSSLMLDADGNPWEVMGVSRDITQRILIANELKREKERAEQYLEVAEVILVGFDTEAKVQLINRKGLQVLGYEEGELIGKDWFRICLPAHEYEHVMTVYRSLVRGEIKPFEYVENSILTKSGELRFIAWHNSVLRDDDGRITGTLSSGEDITERRRAEDALNRRLVSLTQPLDSEDISIEELFSVEDLQRLQDSFAQATGVASLITLPNGLPITKPSNFCELCSGLIRNSEKGLANCMHSDAVIGRENFKGPTIKSCLSGGLIDAGASITLGGKHLANWLIGQVKNETVDESKILDYALDIGVDPEKFREALAKVPVMSPERFNDIAQFLFQIANELSLKAYQNIQQAREITQRQKAEAELKESKDRLTRAEAVSKGGNWEIHLDTGKVTASEGARRIYNIPGSTWTLADIQALPLLEYRPMLDMALKGLLEKGEPYNVEFKVSQNRTGKIIDIHSIAEFDREKRILFGVLQDISERKLAEDMLQKTKAQQKAILDNMPFLAWLKDTKGRFLEVNEPFAKSCGRSRDDLLGRTDFDVWSRELAQKYFDDDQKVMELDKKVHVEEPITEVTGTRWFETYKMPIYDKDHNILGTTGLSADITQRKRSEAALRESEAFNKLLFLSSRTPIVVIDVQTWKYVDCNMAAVEIYRFSSREDVIGKTSLNVSAPIQYDGTPSEGKARFFMDECLKNGSVVFEWLHQRPDGEQWDAEVHLMTFRAQGRSLMQFSLSDISYRKRAERERESLIKDLESKNAELERFTYTVSHDLKSPLITIKGFLGDIGESARRGDFELMEKDLARVNDAGTRMEALLRDLLELSRVGRVVNPSEDFPMGSAVDAAILATAGGVQGRGVRLTVEQGMPAVRADRTRIIEVWQNLIENAVKYMGDQPNPELVIGFLQDGPPTTFFVRDNGIGIDPRYQHRIFGLFDKIDPRSDGTGIGLSLVSRIVELHGGRIWVDSELGKGSTFFFTLGK